MRSASSMAFGSDYPSHIMSPHVNSITGNREKLVSIKKSDLKRGNSRKGTPVIACHPEAQTDMTICFPNAAGRKSICLARPGETPTLETAIAHLRTAEGL